MGVRIKIEGSLPGELLSKQAIAKGQYVLANQAMAGYGSVCAIFG